eukprot:s3101_g11.t1
MTPVAVDIPRARARNSVLVYERDLALIYQLCAPDGAWELCPNSAEFKDVSCIATRIFLTILNLNFETVTGVGLQSWVTKGSRRVESRVRFAADTKAIFRPGSSFSQLIWVICAELKPQWMFERGFGAEMTSSQLTSAAVLVSAAAKKLEQDAVKRRKERKKRGRKIVHSCLDTMFCGLVSFFCWEEAEDE